MDTREAKLPQWAQNSFAALRNQVGFLEAQLAIAHKEAAAQGATGKVMADCLGGKGFPLHDRALVEFHLPGGKVSVMLRDKGRKLDLNADGVLYIQPQAANSVYVTVEE